MLFTFLFTMACTLVLAAVMIAIRYRIEALSDAQPQAQFVLRARTASDLMSYLVVAYAFATVVLGGYLVWSLIRLRDLSR